MGENIQISSRMTGTNHHNTGQVIAISLIQQVVNIVIILCFGTLENPCRDNDLQQEAFCEDAIPVWVGRGQHELEVHHTRPILQLVVLKAV